MAYGATREKFGLDYDDAEPIFHRTGPRPVPMTLSQMRRASGKMNLQSPPSTATSTINTCFCFPPAVPLLALERIPIFACTFPLTQIPIAEPAAPSAHLTRGFVPWRLSDDGRVASRTISIGRHPKPCTAADLPHILTQQAEATIFAVG